MTYVFVAVAVGLIGITATVFMLRRLDLGAQRALGGLDARLSHLADLVPGLATAVREFAPQERAVFDEASTARTSAAQAATSGGVAAKGGAARRLDLAVADVLAVAEAYPALKESDNFQRMQAALSDSERTMFAARQDYNDAVEHLNRTVDAVPWRFFTRLAGVSARATVSI